MITDSAFNQVSEPVPVVGCSRGRGGMPAEWVDRLYADYVRLKSLSKVAKLHGRTRQSVFAVFKTHGKPMQPLKRKAGADVVMVDGEKFTTDKHGHLRSTKRGRGLDIFLHRRIWQREHGPIPKGMELVFINGDKLDVRLENLMLLRCGEIGRLAADGVNGWTHPRAVERRTHARQTERIAGCMGWIVKQAYKWSASGVDMEDLIQEGRMAVVEADAAFDPNRGANFLTYAIWKIRARMQRYVMNTRDTIRVPIHCFGTVRRFCDSLDAAVSAEDETALHDRIAAPEAEAGFLSDGALELLERALAKLPAKTRAILHARFWERRTLEAISQDYGVSRERIRQVIKEGLGLLQSNKELRKEMAA